MKLLVYSSITILVFSFVGCVGLNESSKYQFTDGVYKTKLPGKPGSSVFITVSEDSIQAIPVKKENKQFAADTTGSYTFAFSLIKPPGLFTKYNFTQKTVDLDVLTILFKLRPGTTSLPTQLNTNFNCALYFGFRSDRYSLDYRKTALDNHKKIITHYGYSFGLFTGIGAAAMNPYVTNNHVNSEYDGLVIPNGLAAIVGINNLSVGILLGTDYLLDRNKRFWIYQENPG